MDRRSMMIGAGSTLLLGGAGAAAWRSSVGSMSDYARYARRLRAALPADPTLAELIRYATLAPNSHNTQPWRFRIEEGAVTILPDPSRTTPAVDPDNHHLFVSLGCAAETLAIAAGATGRPGELETDADTGGVRYRFTHGRHRPEPLLKAIAARQSTRAEFDGRPVPADTIERLRRAAVMPGVRLVLLTDRGPIDRVRELVVAGNGAQMADPAFMRELKQWLRFNPDSAMQSGDGLFSATSGNPVLPTALGSLAFDRFFTAAAENDKYARQIRSSAGIAVFVADRADPAHWIAIGRACQRFALTATALGLKHAFINQPVEVAALRQDLAGLVGESGKRPDIVMRFGHGPALLFSPRRPVRLVTI